VVNIPVTAQSLPAGAGSSAPAGLLKGAVQGRTDFGKPGWGGPCPPTGDKPHRYVFTLWALKVDKLDLTAESSGAMVGFNLSANALGKATMKALSIFRTPG
jgi:Raf kinase inhibitor-like YbhB/YbcL family protein